MLSTELENSFYFLNELHAAPNLGLLLLFPRADWLPRKGEPIIQREGTITTVSSHDWNLNAHKRLLNLLVVATTTCDSSHWCYCNMC